MFKRLLLGLLLFPSLVFAGDLQSKRFFQNNGGMIDHISPLLIPDNAASNINNITMDDRGQLSKRNGYTVIISTNALTAGSVTNSTWTVNGMAFHKASSGSDFFAVVVGTNVARISTAFASYSVVTGTATITASATNLAQAAHFKDKVVFCNESDRIFYVGSSGNAFALDSGETTISSATTCATYGNYLVTGNTTEAGVQYPDRVRWSDLNSLNSWPALNYIDVEPDDGDKIVALVPFDESVYVFKKRSIYRILITGVDGPSAFIIRPISRNIGAWAKQSVKVIPNVGIAFLAQNTAYLLSDNGLQPIGDPIQRTFDIIQRSQWANAVAEVYPQRYQYWLAVSTASTTNALTLVYDYVQKNWTTYSGIRINALAQSEDSTGANILISGDYAATTYKQDTGSSDNPGNVSTAISGSYTTADLLFDSPEITKGFKYLYVFTKGDSLFTLTINSAFDYNSNYEHSDTVQIGSSGGTYDTGVYDVNAYPAGSLTVTRIELNRSGKSMRLQFTNSTAGQAFGLVGWTVVYSMENYNQ